MSSTTFQSLAQQATMALLMKAGMKGDVAKQVALVFQQKPEDLKTIVTTFRNQGLAFCLGEPAFCAKLGGPIIAAVGSGGAALPAVMEELSSMVSKDPKGTASKLVQIFKIIIIPAFKKTSQWEGLYKPGLDALLNAIVGMDLATFEQATDDALVNSVVSKLMSKFMPASQNTVPAALTPGTAGQMAVYRYHSSNARRRSSARRRSIARRRSMTPRRPDASHHSGASWRLSITNRPLRERHRSGTRRRSSSRRPAVASRTPRHVHSSRRRRSARSPRY